MNWTACHKTTVAAWVAFILQQAGRIGVFYPAGPMGTYRLHGNATGSTTQSYHPGSPCSIGTYIFITDFQSVLWVCFWLDWLCVFSFVTWFLYLYKNSKAGGKSSSAKPDTAIKMCQYRQTVTIIGANILIFITLSFANWFEVNQELQSLNDTSLTNLKILPVLKP